MLRYLKSLENMDLALNTSMISLGSCTMKVLSVCLCVFVSPCLCVFVSSCLTLCLSSILFVCVSVSLCLCVCLSVCLSVLYSVCVCLCIMCMRPFFCVHASSRCRFRLDQHLQHNLSPTPHRSLFFLPSHAQLNASVEMFPVTWPETGNMHPFCPPDQVAAVFNCVMFVDLLNLALHCVCTCTRSAARLLVDYH
jgi:hypothetical protein